MKRLLIAVPSYDTKLHVDFVAFIGRVQAMKRKYKKELDIEISVKYFTDMLIQDARNLIFKYAYNHGFDYLLMIDSDNRVDENVLFMMVNQFDVESSETKALCFGNIMSAVIPQRKKIPGTKNKLGIYEFVSEFNDITDS